GGGGGGRGGGRGPRPRGARPVVRRRVAEAARQAIRRSPSVRAFFERARRGDPQRQKVALVAAAHSLVRVMWALLRHGTAWRESGARAGYTDRRSGTTSARGVRPTPPRDPGPDPGCIPRADRARHDAAGVNGSNRILSHGAPQRG